MSLSPYPEKLKPLTGAEASQHIEHCLKSSVAVGMDGKPAKCPSIPGPYDHKKLLSQDQVEDMFRRYKKVCLGSKVCMVDSFAPAHQIIPGAIPTRDFEIQYSKYEMEILTPNGNQTRTSAARRWHEGLDPYARVDFRPDKPSPYDFEEYGLMVFNLFRGYQIAPAKGNIDLYWEFLEKVICYGNKELADWVDSWVSQMYQNPETKPGTALALLGGQGIGKDTFVEIITRPLGDSYYQKIANMDVLFSQFNEHLAACLLLYANEATWGGDHRGAGILKDEITADNRLLNPKHKGSSIIKNYTRYIFASNEMHALRINNDDRRYCVLQVSDAKKNDHRYFKKLRDWLNKGGYEAVFHHWLNKDIGPIDRYRKAPETAGRLNQIIESFDLLERAFFQFLYDEKVFPDDDSLNTEYRRDQIAAFINSEIKRKYEVETNPQSIGTFLKKIGINSKERKVYMPDRDQKTWKKLHGDSGEPILSQGRIFTFPPIDQFRKIFENYVGQPFDWNENMEPRENE